MEIMALPTTSSTSDCSSPFENKVTFKLIMDYVGTDHRSLMRCRLVAHPWNQMALTILNLNGTTLAIGGDRPPWKSRPDTVLHDSLEYLKDMSERTTASGSLAEAFDKLPIAYYVKVKEPKVVNYLLRPVVPAQVNVTSITYQTGGKNLLDSTFWEAVRASSINLQTLRLNVILWDSVSVLPHASSASNEYQLPLGDAPFPKLTRLQIRCRTGEVQRLRTIPTQVARLAPIMKNLRFVLSSSLYNSTDGIDFTTSEQLKKIFSPGICASAHKLEAPVPYLAYLASISRISPELFPIFRNLHLLQLTMSLTFNEVAWDTFTAAIAEFLGHNQPTSLSLDLTLAWPNFLGAVQAPLPHGNGQPQPALRNLFPVLPGLVHLGLYEIPYRGFHRVFMCNLLRSVASSCVGLKSLAIDHSMYWTVAPRPRPEEQQDVPWYMQDRQVVFGNVEILLLAIRTNFRAWSEDDDDHQVARMTNALFPSLKQVFVENSCEFRGLERMVMPELMEIRGISTLGFKTTYKILLTSQFLRPRLAASQFAQRLERLELKMLKCHSSARQKRPTRLHVEDLEDLLNILPRLTVFEIDWKLLSGQDYGDINFQEILDEVQQIRLNFPNVDIRVL